MSSLDSGSTIGSEAVFDKWDSNIWKSNTVSRILSADSDIINLISKSSTKRKKEVKVHKDLLCHYSSYYRGALRGSFLEATTTTIEVDLNDRRLALFVGWMYTGKLHSEDYRTLLRLYIFADMTDILALRRAIMSRLWEIDHNDTRSDICSYSEVKLAWTTLTDASPIRRYMLDGYVYHWRVHLDKNVSHEEAPAGFFYSMLCSRERKTEAHMEVDCPCCHDLCGYHEHESDEERDATCNMDD